ncbi:hypothetical protein J6590_095726, partial [Homalodisca vitripennis]
LRQWRGERKGGSGHSTTFVAVQIRPDILDELGSPFKLKSSQKPGAPKSWDLLRPRDPEIESWPEVIQDMDLSLGP